MQFPCFGLNVLGLCSYNPAQPSPTYFTIGDAVAALGFTLAILQLIKPIYLFRLRALGLKLTVSCSSRHQLGVRGGRRAVYDPDC
jgi:hypothetical protein